MYEVRPDGVHHLIASSISYTATLKLVKSVLEQHPDLSISLYNSDRWIAQRVDKGTEFETSLTQIEPELMSYQTLFEDNQINIFKIMMITFDEDEMQALIQELDGLGLSGVSIQRSGPYHLEVTSDQAKKSRGIQYLLQNLDLTKANTAAFGDGHNDLPMFREVGHAIAMGNALPEIKKNAEFITTSCDEDGIAYALENSPIFK